MMKKGFYSIDSRGKAYFKVEIEYSLMMELNSVVSNKSNRTECNIHLRRKTAVLNCHRCLKNNGVDKINNN
jgi:hypothetical protein